MTPVEDDFSVLMDDAPPTKDATPSPKLPTETFDEDAFLAYSAGDEKTDFKLRDWMKDCVAVLVTTENIAACIDACIASPAGKCALDLETTGLDNRVYNGKTRDHIVGVCLSPDGKTGYYIPVRHQESDANIPMDVFDREFRRLIAAIEAGKLIAIFHNGEFDQEFLEFNGMGAYGTWDKPGQWRDTLIQVYLADARRRNKQLKHLTKEEFGADQIELDELYPPGYKGKKDFSLLDPRKLEVLWYGAGDGIWTYRLDDKTLPLVVGPTANPDQNTIYKIERGCVAATRWMQRNRIKISREKVKELITLAQQEWHDSVLDVYTAASEILKRDVMPGHYKFLFQKDKFKASDYGDLVDAQLDRAKRQYLQEFPDPVGTISGTNAAGDKKDYPLIYDVNAPVQLGLMFDEMKVPGLRLTDKSKEAQEKAGKGEVVKVQIKTSKDEIERIIEEAGATFPFMQKIRRFRETSRALSNYLAPMLHDADPTDDTIRIGFKAHKVDTGRFCTPSREDKTNKRRVIGWPAINIQAIPASYDPKRPPSMTRLRECIVARDPNKVVVSIDYSGVELRLVTNLSLEPKWLDEYFRCSNCTRTFSRGDGTKTPDPPPPRCPNCGSDKIGDLHTLTALEIYGTDAASRSDWKQLRQQAKATNFALCYGGGGNAVVRATGCDKNEGHRIKAKYDKTYNGLRSWWVHQHKYARSHGYVLTAFGRKYPLPDINSADGGFRSKAERNAVNGPIQGSSADITKASMALIYKEVKKRGWLEKVLMVITMHDELVFEIDLDILEEAIEVLMNLMVRNQFVLGQKWPVPLTSDVEIGPSWAVPWSLNEMRYGEIRFNGTKKIKKPADVPQGMKWEDLPSFHPTLEPHFKYKTNLDLEIGLKQQGAFGIYPPVEGVVAAVQTVQRLTGPGVLPAYSSPGPVGKNPGEFEYRIRGDLTVATAYLLAQVIHDCRGKGVSRLKLLTQDGQPVDGWENIFRDRAHDTAPLTFHPEEFEVIARNKGV